MSNLIEHSEREFKALGWPGDCEMQQVACANLLELLETFSGQGHSGSSAQYIINLFERLAKFQPISPLTGEDYEWNNMSTPGSYDLFQNNRDSEVFKDATSAYWASGKIFRDSDGCTYTNKDSRIPIEFPWTKPAPMIVDVKNE